MLVLRRKPGEQIVLPELDITVTVLRISGMKVRLGIVAPPDMSILRHEIRDQGCERTMSPPTPTAAASKAMSLVPRPSDLEALVAQSITRRTEGQIGSLHVEATDERVVVHGRARSYYARQLALAAVTETLQATRSSHTLDVDYRIEMVTDQDSTGNSLGD